MGVGTSIILILTPYRKVDVHRIDKGFRWQKEGDMSSTYCFIRLGRSNLIQSQSKSLSRYLKGSRSLFVGLKRNVLRFSLYLFPCVWEYHGTRGKWWRDSFLKGNFQRFSEVIPIMSTPTQGVPHCPCLILIRRVFLHLHFIPICPFLLLYFSRVVLMIFPIFPVPVYVDFVTLTGSERNFLVDLID